MTHIPLTLNNLKLVCEDLLEVSSDEEYNKLLECSQNPLPEMREFIIELRNQAVSQAAWDWALLLSHFISAMTYASFWEGEEIQYTNL